MLTQLTRLTDPHDLMDMRDYFQVHLQAGHMQPILVRRRQQASKLASTARLHAWQGCSTAYDTHTHTS